MKRLLILIFALGMSLMSLNLMASDLGPGPYQPNQDIAVYEIMGLDILDDLRTNFTLKPCQCCPPIYAGHSLSGCFYDSYFVVNCTYNGTSVILECW